MENVVNEEPVKSDLATPKRDRLSSRFGTTEEVIEKPRRPSRAMVRGHEELKEVIEDIFARELLPGQSYRQAIIENLARRAVGDDPRADAFAGLLLKNRYGEAPKELSRMEMLEKLMESFPNDELRGKFAQMMLEEVETEFKTDLSLPPKILKWTPELLAKKEDLPCLIEKGVDSIRLENDEALQAFNFGQRALQNQMIELGRFEERIKQVEAQASGSLPTALPDNS